MIPTARRDEEHIDSRGHLRVPLERAISLSPTRAGWKPFWVNVNLDDPIQKVVVYRKVSS
jgi:hypothetical protein